MENPSEQSNWLTENPKSPGALKLGTTMLSVNLVTQEEQPVEKPPNSGLLKATEWEKQPELLPKRGDESAKH